ncbi:hypothetical protein [Pseudoruegeria sp. SHC-113]|uniref:hypothetical protein n=1 Tax=Pseudoruegeria sp. SHC-113 TaxID=2855439 RepID=UPI0021BA6228|nr:hypothetical protein [Pseudoruegeria sp. SHC-113]MCT8160036.1 hypothetical protein [Pseudoruegeria sp. SHC-113]
MGEHTKHPDTAAALEFAQEAHGLALAMNRILHEAGRPCDISKEQEPEVYAIAAALNRATTAAMETLDVTCPPSLIEMLFNEWLTASAGAAQDKTNEAVNATGKRIAQLTEQILALPSDSTHALQIKIAVADAGGDLRLNTWGERLAEQAWAAIGKSAPKF